MTYTVQMFNALTKQWETKLISTPEPQDNKIAAIVRELRDCGINAFVASNGSMPNTPSTQTLEGNVVKALLGEG